MERTVIVGIVFALIAVGWILGTGQWAYGNVVGPLVNYSKLPKVEVPYVSAAPTTDGTILTLNLTDVDGPDAYPASVVMIEIGTPHGTFSLTPHSWPTTPSRCIRRLGTKTRRTASTGTRGSRSP